LVDEEETSESFFEFLHDHEQKLENVFRINWNTSSSTVWSMYDQPRTSLHWKAKMSLSTTSEVPKQAINTIGCDVYKVMPTQDNVQASEVSIFTQSHVLVQLLLKRYCQLPCPDPTEKPTK